MKLERLTAANNIEHVGAHDALVDVRATIAMARLLKKSQPRLYDFAFQLRSKKFAGGAAGFEKSSACVAHIRQAGRQVFVHVVGDAVDATAGQ
jgi:exonuclease I